METQEQKISPEVYFDLKGFIFQNIDAFKQDAKDYAVNVTDTETGEPAEPSLDITFSVSEDGTEWAYQTGDNSFTGSCYSHPHWAVSSILLDTDPLGLYEDICEQLEELI